MNTGASMIRTLSRGWVAGDSAPKRSSALRRVWNVDKEENIAAGKSHSRRRRSKPILKSTCCWMKCSMKQCDTKKCPYGNRATVYSLTVERPRKPGTTVPLGKLQALAGPENGSLTDLQLKRGVSMMKIGEDSHPAADRYLTTVQRNLLFGLAVSCRSKGRLYDREWARLWRCYVGLRELELDNIAVSIGGATMPMTREDALAYLQHTLPEPSDRDNHLYPTDSVMSDIVEREHEQEISTIPHAYAEYSAELIAEELYDNFAIAVEHVRESGTYTPRHLDLVLDGFVDETEDKVAEFEDVQRQAGVAKHSFARVVRRIFTDFKENGALYKMRFDVRTLDAHFPRALVRIGKMPWPKQNPVRRPSE